MFRIVLHEQSGPATPYTAPGETIVELQVIPSVGDIIVKDIYNSWWKVTLVVYYASQANSNYDAEVYAVYVDRDKELINAGMKAV